MEVVSNNTIVKGYNRIFTELAGATILVLYLFFTLKWGPRYMANKNPFQLKKTLVIYNFLQVVVSVWLFNEGLEAGWLRTYSWKCQPVDTSDSPEAMRISELLDTVFFVIRKKERQITFLHLYHHTVMPMISWGATKYYPGGHGTLIGVVNSFVHIIMYTYYMFAAFGPRFQRYLFWKKYITTLQMAYGTPEDRKKAKALANGNGYIKHENENKHEVRSNNENGQVGNGVAKKYD
ncbi:Elongation of very long chain fatty acids protein [Operophtera brumata]|uniref:Elongation of very long chain fatty acids protein n=1 Tax=Operophtera brumata TaxID=104452 RepID=A0A0L7L029_OPEBR|nr:Elongation of very long chain fatty acids protein [Operophtera brumata]